MPAGDLLPTDMEEFGEIYAAEINGLLMGYTSAYRISGISGPGDVKIRRITDDNGLGPGSSNGYDFLSSVNYDIQGWCHSGSASTGEIAIDALWQAWNPPEGAVDVELHLWRPGFGHQYVTGRPVDMTPVREFMPGGYFTFVATFEASDPIPTQVTVLP